MLTDEDEDEDDDDDEVEDICPPGCDVNLYDRIIDLRDKKLDTEEITNEIQKAIDDYKRIIDRAKQREKQIIKDGQQTDLEVQQFQLQKQAALNKIEIVVPLQFSQLNMFDTSGVLTGPTDKPQAESAELAEVIDILKDVDRRMLVSKIDLNSHTLFARKYVLLLLSHTIICSSKPILRLQQQQQ